ncbi:hypothetical protein DFH06DRAFT_1308300 [Mycena polygramma]|nr:hypothetical protein DFH06DRAFT_1308300 [Mycena polygramma]
MARQVQDCLKPHNIIMFSPLAPPPSLPPSPFKSMPLLNFWHITGHPVVSPPQISRLDVSCHPQVLKKLSSIFDFQSSARSVQRCQPQAAVPFVRDRDYLYHPFAAIGHLEIFGFASRFPDVCFAHIPRIATLVTSTPGYWLLLSEHWGNLLPPLRHESTEDLFVRVCETVERLNCGFINEENFHSMVDGAGGTLYDLASLITQHMRMITRDFRLPVPEIAGRLFMSGLAFLTHVSEFDPRIIDAVLRQGIVVTTVWQSDISSVDRCVPAAIYHPIHQASWGKDVARWLIPLSPSRCTLRSHNGIWNTAIKMLQYLRNEAQRGNFSEQCTAHFASPASKGERDGDGSLYHYDTQSWAVLHAGADGQQDGRNSVQWLPAIALTWAAYAAPLAPYGGPGAAGESEGSGNPTWSALGRASRQLHPVHVHGCGTDGTTDTGRATSTPAIATLATIMGGIGEGRDSGYGAIAVGGVDVSRERTHANDDTR